MDGIYNHIPLYHQYRFEVKVNDEQEQINKAEKSLRDFENHFSIISCNDYIPFCINKRSMETIVRNRNRRSIVNEITQNGSRNYNSDNYNINELGDEVGPIEQEDEEEEEDDDAAISEISDREMYTRRNEDMQEDDIEMDLPWSR